MGLFGGKKVTGDDEHYGKMKGKSKKDIQRDMKKKGSFYTEGTIKSRGTKGNKPLNADGSPRSTWW